MSEVFAPVVTYKRISGLGNQSPGAGIGTGPTFIQPGTLPLQQQQQIRRGSGTGPISLARNIEVTGSKAVDFLLKF